jgi:hypothetical protein
MPSLGLESGWAGFTTRNHQSQAQFAFIVHFLQREFVASELLSIKGTFYFSLQKKMWLYKLACSLYNICVYLLGYFFGYCLVPKSNVFIFVQQLFSSPVFWKKKIGI